MSAKNVSKESTEIRIEPAQLETIKKLLTPSTTRTLVLALVTFALGFLSSFLTQSVSLQMQQSIVFREKIALLLEDMQFKGDERLDALTKTESTLLYEHTQPHGDQREIWKREAENFRIEASGYPSIRSYYVRALALGLFSNDPIDEMLISDSANRSDIEIYFNNDPQSLFEKFQFILAAEYLIDEFPSIYVPATEGLTLGSETIRKVRLEVESDMKHYRDRGKEMLNIIAQDLIQILTD